MFDLQENHIEKIIVSLKETGGYIAEQFWNQKFAEPDFCGDAILADIARKRMIVEGIIEEHQPHLFVLTSKGHRFRGYAEERKIDELNFRLVNINVENAKRVKATYWWSFGFSVVALLISLVLLILKLRE